MYDASYRASIQIKMNDQPSVQPLIANRKEPKRTRQGFLELLLRLCNRCCNGREQLQKRAIFCFTTHSKLLLLIITDSIKYFSPSFQKQMLVNSLAVACTIASKINVTP